MSLNFVFSAAHQNLGNDAALHALRLQEYQDFIHRDIRHNTDLMYFTEQLLIEGGLEEPSIEQVDTFMAQIIDANPDQFGMLGVFDPQTTFDMPVGTILRIPPTAQAANLPRTPAQEKILEQISDYEEPGDPEVQVTADTETQDPADPEAQTRILVTKTPIQIDDEGRIFRDGQDITAQAKDMNITNVSLDPEIEAQLLAVYEASGSPPEGIVKDMQGEVEGGIGFNDNDYSIWYRVENGAVKIEIIGENNRHQMVNRDNLDQGGLSIQDAEQFMSARDATPRKILDNDTSFDEISSEIEDLEQRRVVTQQRVDAAGQGQDAMIEGEPSITVTIPRGAELELLTKQGRQVDNLEKNDIDSMGRSVTLQQTADGEGYLLQFSDDRVVLISEDSFEEIMEDQPGGVEAAWNNAIPYSTQEFEPITPQGSTVDLASDPTVSGDGQNADATGDQPQIQTTQAGM